MVAISLKQIAFLKSKDLLGLLLQETKKITKLSEADHMMNRFNFETMADVKVT